jgi:hypothetical protein
MKNRLTLFLLFFFSLLHAQTTQLKLYGVLINQQSEFTSISSPTTSTLLQVEKLNWSLLPAIAWENDRHHFQELGFGQFRFQVRNDYREATNSSLPIPEPIQGNRLTEWDVFFHYSYNLNLIKEPRKVKCFIGFGAQPGFHYEKVVPKTSANFPETSFQLRVNGLVIPRAQFQLGQRIWLDVHIPVHIAQAGLERRRQENPQLPNNRQVSAIQFFDLAPQFYEFRTGLVYLL